MNPRKVLCAWFSIVMVAGSLGLWAQATPPGRVNFQGTVQSASGTPLNGPQAMSFQFYDDPAAGNLLWGETYSALTVSAGLFTVALGDPAHKSGGSEPTFQGVFANHGAVYLAVQAGADPAMTPRIQVVAAPFAENAGTLDGKQASEFAAAAHTHAGTDITSAVAEAAHAASADTAAALSATLAAAKGGTGLTSPGASGNVLTSSGSAWVSSPLPATSSAGVMDASDATLTRTGSGSMSDPYKLKLNLGNTNTWTVPQTFSSNALFGGPGIWGASGRVGIGTITPDWPLSIKSQQAVAYLDSTGVSDGSVVELRNHTAGASTLGAINFNNPTGTYPGQIAYMSGNSMTFRVNGSQAVTIDSGGALWSGTPGITLGSYKIIGVRTNGSHQAFGGLGYSDNTDYIGVYGQADSAGGLFNGGGSASHALVGYETYKIWGNGTVSFVQDHPTQKDRVIVYACPEGDEVATYTRGTARLVNGEAHVKLGETFQWVTNPDLGLTAHLTPRGDCKGLYVSSLSTTEMVVKELDGGTSGAAFDYLVYGLRIGFEESSIVQEKRFEAYIPSFAGHRERYAKYPELRAFNAFERFKTMAASVHPERALDLSRASALKSAIHEYDPATDPPANRLLGYGGVVSPDGTGASASAPAAAASAPSAREAYGANGMRGESSLAQTAPSASASSTATTETSAPAAERFPVCEAVEAGDILVADSARPGAFCLGRIARDPNVVGIAAVPSVQPDGSAARQESIESFPSVPIATTGIVLCKVDAGYAPIHTGDLLVVSPTPGRAMKAVDAAPGTVLGKALESLESGTGAIKVLVMMR